MKESSTMRCIGRRKDFKRCKNTGKRMIFCRTHRFQPVFALITLIGTYVTFNEFLGYIGLPTVQEYYENRKTSLVLESSNSCSLQFSDSKKLKILFLPFYGYDACDLGVPCEIALIKGVYKNVSQDEVEIIYCDSISLGGISSDQLIDSIAASKNCDIVVWGDYEKPYCQEDSTRIYINFKTNSRLPTLSGVTARSGKEFKSPLLDVSSGKILGTLDELIYWMLASQELFENNNTKALGYLEKIAVDSSHDISIYKDLIRNKGVINMNLGNYEKGYHFLRQAYDLDPEDVFTLMNLMVFYYRTSDQTNVLSFARRIDSVISHSSVQIDLKSLAILFENQMSAFSLAKDSPNLKKYALLLHQLRPNHHQANRYLAGIYFDEKDYDKSAYHLDLAIKFPSDKDMEGLYVMRSTLFALKNEYRNAFEYYNIAFRLNPKSEVVDSNAYLTFWSIDNHVKSFGCDFEDIDTVIFDEKRKALTYYVDGERIELPKQRWVVVKKDD